LSTRSLHSFPTRRSSDLPLRIYALFAKKILLPNSELITPNLLTQEVTSIFSPISIVEPSVRITDCGIMELRMLKTGSNCLEKSRSEEHTSELQSREKIVC